jgi:hypothetical protein
LGLDRAAQRFLGAANALFIDTPPFVGPPGIRQPDAATPHELLQGHGGNLGVKRSTWFDTCSGRGAILFQRVRRYRPRPLLLVPGWGYHRGTADAASGAHLRAQSSMPVVRDAAGRTTLWTFAGDRANAMLAGALRAGGMSVVSADGLTLIVRNADAGGRGCD